MTASRLPDPAVGLHRDGAPSPSRPSQRDARWERGETLSHDTVRSIELMLARAAAPMHKRVLGLAIGLTAATAIWLLTMFHVLVRPRGALPIELLSQIFYGFAVTWRGALIGWWSKASADRSTPTHHRAGRLSPTSSGWEPPGSRTAPACTST